MDTVNIRDIPLPQRLEQADSTFLNEYSFKNPKTQTILTEFLNLLDILSFDKENDNPVVLDKIWDLLQIIVNKIEDFVRENTIIWPIREMTMYCRLCKSRIHASSFNKMNLSTPLSEENLQLVVEIFDATSKNLDVGYDLLSLLYDRLNGALFFIALNNHHHLNRMHGDQLNVKYIEHLFCGICNCYVTEPCGDHFAHHFRPEITKVNKPKINKTCNLEKALFLEGINSKSNLSVATINRIIEDLVDTFTVKYPKVTVSPIGSQVYKIGNGCLDLIVRLFTSTANNCMPFVCVNILSDMLSRRPDLWTITNAKRNFTYCHKPTETPCKTMAATVYSEYECNTLMLKYLMELQPEFRDLVEFLVPLMTSGLYPGTWSRYSIILLVIVFLQTQKLLPSITYLKHKSDNGSSLSTREWLTTFKYDVTLEQLSIQKMRNFQTYLISFFEFMMNHPLEKHIFSPFSGSFCKRKTVQDGSNSIAIRVEGLLDFFTNTTAKIYNFDPHKMQFFYQNCVSTLDQILLTDSSQEPEHLLSLVSSIVFAPAQVQSLCVLKTEETVEFKIQEILNKSSLNVHIEIEQMFTSVDNFVSLMIFGSKNLMKRRCYDSIHASLQTTFKEVYPNASFFFHGSRMLGVGTKRSKLLIVMKPQIFQVTIIKTLEKVPKIWKLILGRNNILRSFVHIPSGVECSITSSKNGEMFDYNTRMIRYFLNLQPEFHRLALYMDKWFRCAHLFIGSYSLMLLLSVYLQKLNLLPTMLELQAKCKELKIISGDVSDDSEWLKNFNFNSMLDLGLAQMEDYKVYLQDFFNFMNKHSIEEFAFIPYSGDIVKKSELSNFELHGEKVYDGYRVSGLFVTGLLDYANDVNFGLEFGKDETHFKNTCKWSEELMSFHNAKPPKRAEKVQETETAPPVTNDPQDSAIPDSLLQLESMEDFERQEDSGSDTDEDEPSFILVTVQAEVHPITGQFINDQHDDETTSIENNGDTEPDIDATNNDAIIVKKEFDDGEETEE